MSIQKLLSEPRARLLSDRCFRLLFRSICEAERLVSDGYLASRDLLDMGVRAKELRELVESGAWEAVGDGIVITDYLAHKPSRAQIQARRESTRRRMRRHRGDSDCDTPCDSVTSGVTDAVTQPVTDGVTTGVTDMFGSPTPPPELNSGSGLLLDPESSSTLSSSPKDLTGSARKSPNRASRSRKTMLPEDWKPSESHLERAQKTLLNCESEAEKFRLHAEGTGRLMASWNAAFTTWLINAAEFRRNAPGKPPGLVIHEQTRPLHPHEMTRVQRILAEAEKNRKAAV